MSKITLNAVGSLIDTTTAANTINANSVTVQTAFDNTLSRDGTQPNTMGASLDMNSHQILNCPAPISGSEPVRLTDLATYATGGTVTFNALPVGGTAGQFLKKNSSANYDASWTGTFSFAIISATTEIFVGSSPSADDTAFLACRPLAPGSGLLNSHGYRDETNATQAVTGSQFSGYASFDAAPNILGTATTPMNHIRAFQARPVYNSSGHVSEFAGLWTQATVTNAAGTIDNAYGVHVVSPIISAGGITTITAFYSDPLSGAITSYFLFGEGVNGTTANPSVLKGNLYIGGRINQLSVEVANVQFDGSTRQGWLFADTYAVAGATSAAVFYRNNSNVGAIQTTLTGTNYTSASDERRKDFIGEYDHQKAIEIIKADPVRDFTWKETGDYAVGWGAQSSYKVNPDLAVKPQNEEDLWSIDQSKRTPYLWAAVSNILDRLEALEKA